MRKLDSGFVPTPLMEVFSFAGKKIVQAGVPDWAKWGPLLLAELDAGRTSFELSHKIRGRWENSYLPVDKVPGCREPMRFARALGKEVLNIVSVMLFEPLPFSSDPHPPFWFNLAQPGEETGLHDHASQSVLSGVVYLACEEGSGNLFFRADGEDDLEIYPVVSRLVLFDPSIKHGVRENRSATERISLAFNLFPFPLPAVDL